MKIHMFLHEFDRDSSKKLVFTVNLCFEAFKIIFFQDLLNVYGCFMTVKRLFFTRWCGDGSYAKLCFHVDESALSIERPPEALKIDVFSRVVWLGMCIL